MSRMTCSRKFNVLEEGRGRSGVRLPAAAMRNSLSEELRGRIRMGAVQARSGAARIAAGIRSWRWKSVLETGSPPHFLSGSSLRGVSKAPKLLLLGLLILQLLVLAILRSSSTAATAASSSLRQREQPRISRALHTHAKIREEADEQPHSDADRGGGAHFGEESGRAAAGSRKSGELPLPARKSEESRVLSTALDDAASSVSDNGRGDEEQLKIPELPEADEISGEDRPHATEEDDISTAETALLHAGEEIEEQEQRDDEPQEMLEEIPGKSILPGEEQQNENEPREEPQMPRDEDPHDGEEMRPKIPKNFPEKEKISKTPKVNAEEEQADLEQVQQQQQKKKIAEEKQQQQEQEQKKNAEEKQHQQQKKKIAEEKQQQQQEQKKNAEEKQQQQQKKKKIAEEKQQQQQQQQQNAEENQQQQQQKKKKKNAEENQQQQQEQQKKNAEEKQQQQQKKKIAEEKQQEQKKNAEEKQQQQQQREEQEGESEISASEAAILEEDPVCKGGRIFVYKLPRKFNSDLVANCSTLNPWTSLCDAFSNGGLGKPMTITPWPSSTPSPWYYTEQFSGELIYHTRLLRHPCLTNDSSSANVFYVPFYAGLDVSRYLWRPSDAGERDRLGRQLVKWLRKQAAWRRGFGRDHFTMIGRITWDFRRAGDKEWGSGLLNLPEMKNMTRLIIEREPWEGGEFGVPYPTSFHPRTEHEVQEWQEFVRTRERKVLFSFAGAARTKSPNDFRLEILAQCSGSGECSAMDCSEGRCERPEPVVEMFMNSTFCLQPRGDTYTRRSIFDSMLAGCIPVFFWRQSSYWQYQWFFPEEEESFSVFIDRGDVRKGVKIGEVLGRFSAEEVRRMRNGVIDVLPRLVYGTADHELSGADAFDTAIDGVLRSMLRMNVRAGRGGGSSRKRDSGSVM